VTGATVYLELHPVINVDTLITINSEPIKDDETILLCLFVINFEVLVNGKLLFTGHEKITEE